MADETLGAKLLRAISDPRGQTDEVKKALVALVELVDSASDEEQLKLRSIVDEALERIKPPKMYA